MSFRPLWGYVLIRPLAKQTKTQSGIILPDSATDSELLDGEVVAVGSGGMASNGDPIPMEINITWQVVFPKWSAKEIHVDGQKMYVVEQREILGVRQ